MHIELQVPLQQTEPVVQVDCVPRHPHKPLGGQNPLTQSELTLHGWPMVVDPLVPPDEEEPPLYPRQVPLAG